MARADTVTWLSLDRYAQIMGIHPAHFNGVYSATFPDTSGCSELWFQYAWQDGGKVSREDIAMAIHDAEQQMAAYIGYHLLPDWRCDERKLTDRPNPRELFALNSRNIRGQDKSVLVDRGWYISGGVKAKTLITAGAFGSFADLDGDGYEESALFYVTSDADYCEIRAYHEGKSGADAWEIRPVTVEDGGAGSVLITCKKWQLADVELWEAMNAKGIDGDVEANFCQCDDGGDVPCIDVYRVYNDPSTQAQFQWLNPECSTCSGSGCTACQHGAQDGCLHARDYRLGTVAYSPATWDATTETFAASAWSECREPDRVRLWYYSGFKADCVACPEKTMDPALERAIAYFATALLDRALCSCENVQRFADRWREDLTMTNTARSYQNGQQVLDNPFGPWRGAVYAWQYCNRDGVKLPRAVAG